MSAYSKEQYENEINARRDKMRTKISGSISSSQQWARELFDAKAPPFVRRTSFAAPPEDDLLDQLCSTIDELKLSDITFSRPRYVDVKAEWVFVSKAAADEENVAGPVTLYVHGGGFLYGSSATARRVTSVLAALTGGCCVVPQYRYATEQPFPAQLLDILVVYCSLLLSGIPSHHIVFAGESSGLSLLMAMTQIILHLRRKDRLPRLRFCGRDLEVHLPVAVAGMSGFFDVTNGLPSWRANGRWDLFEVEQPTYLTSWENQDIWPTDPPRADVYCERSAMIHPLVSPVTAQDWNGAPPFFIAIGEERVADANLFLARAAACQGVRVRLERWEHMTHVWSTTFPNLPHSQRVLENWAGFCLAAVDRKDGLQTEGWDISFETMRATPFDVLACTSLTREKMMAHLSEAQRSRLIVRRREQQSAKM